MGAATTAVVGGAVAAGAGAAELGSEGEGSYIRTRLADETGALNPGNPTVLEVLKGKLGSITKAPLPKGSPSWAETQDLSLKDIREGAKRGEVGYRTILKLLGNNRFNKP